ncbi:gephyrin-like molybdotransferase Glp [Methylotenera sp. 1P/1]|jgi:molybdopterin molybdotransferase|uniref:molybdopterin molybdotransferase MoeA n=1 Tax=Methylotenera sp. 1P/1 TaxID=1131551 RepID=UPI00036D84DD|nr:gephyrin-like molybdotransferase Glp [Methylotenera sp. 1P/1]
MTTPSLTQLATDPSCMEDYDPNAMSVSQAKNYIKQYLKPVSEKEALPIHESLGRVLADTIVSPCNVPNHDNSAMDGFAFRHQDGALPLNIIGTALAGQPFQGALNQGECIKIMTGGVVPSSADCVVMQERTSVQQNLLTITELPKLGANIRKAGEDLMLGQTVLPQGHRMTPADLGLVASLGIPTVTVYRRLKVAFFSTGDELVGVGKLLAEGQIYDSNRYTLFGMLTRLGVEVSDLGAIPDNPTLLEQTLLKAAATHDAVITSGGVSVGEADHMKTLLAQHGEVLFWKMNMKPGRPLAYGKVHTASNSAHYFGLPGNPVATMVTFYQFVRDALILMMGASPKPYPTLKVECTESIKKAAGRTEFQRGVMYEVDGNWKVKPLPNQSSGVLSSMSYANCFIVLGETVANLNAGETVEVQLFEGII